MRHLLVGSFACTLAVSVAGQTIKLDRKNVEAFVAERIQVALERDHIPGAAFALVVGEQCVFATGYGLADIERDVAVDPDRTVFRVASLSKPVTATAIAQLVERGLLEFEGDVDSYLRHFRTHADSRGAITVHHLLTHTAGYDERNVGRAVRDFSEAPPLAEFLESFQPRRVFGPGDVCSYSNYGYALLGHLVEVASGTSFADYVQQNVLDPLGMEHSGFGRERSPRTAIAVGYREIDGQLRAVDPGWDIGGAASSFGTTASDFARFMLAHLNGGAMGGARILSTESTETLHRRHFSNDPRVTGACYGWFERERRGWRRLEHGGYWTGFVSRVVLVPDLQMGVFVAMNADSAGWAARDVIDALLDEILPDRSESKVVAPLEPSHAAELAGSYQSTQFARDNIERITSLLERDTVEWIGDARLRFQWTDYVEVEPFVFEPAPRQEYETRSGPLVFVQGADGRTRLFSGRVTYDRVAWHDTLFWQGLFLLACLTFAGAPLLFWLVAKIRRRSVDPMVIRACRIAVLLDACIGLLGLGIYLTVDGAIGHNGGEFAFGVPLATRLLLAVPFLAIALLLWLAIATGRVWRLRLGSSWPTRIVLLLAVLGNVGFVAWLADWNLLGYRY